MRCITIINECPFRPVLMLERGFWAGGGFFSLFLLRPVYVSRAFARKFGPSG